MNLFIQNPTHQTQMFNYRVNHQKDPRFILIDPGAQVEIPNLDTDNMRLVIRQLEAYGAIKPNDVSTHRKIYTSLIYSVGKPIGITTGTVTHEANVEALNILGHNIRAASAIAVDETLNKSLREAGFSASSKGMQESQIVGEDVDGNKIDIDETLQLQGN